MLTTKDKGRHIKHYVKKAVQQILFKEYGSKINHCLHSRGCFDNFLQVKRPESGKSMVKTIRQTLALNNVKMLFDRMPPSEISETAIEFALKLLELNKQRLLEVTL